MFKLLKNELILIVLPKLWFDKYENEQLAIQERILKAQNCLNNIIMNTDFQLKISQLCSELEIEGLRGDIVTTRAAKALAAFEDRSEVTLEDIKRQLHYVFVIVVDVIQWNQLIQVKKLT